MTGGTGVPSACEMAGGEAGPEGKMSMSPENAKSWLRGLFMECPAGESLKGCPAREIRKLSVEDRMKIVRGVNLETTEKILKYHEACLHKRRNC
jgi:hypothetical protein